MKIRENVPISELTTMRLGGAARFVVEIERPEEIEEANDFAQEKDLPYFILGGGANTLGRDEGYNGVILLNRIRGVETREVRAGTEEPASEAEIVAGEAELLIRGGGGEVWDDIVKLACEKGYTGIECLSAIPGTLGAAPVQNIGAYGQEVSEVLESVEVYDQEYDEFRTLPAEDLNFGYRRSILNHEDKGQYFVTYVNLRLKKWRRGRVLAAGEANGLATSGEMTVDGDSVASDGAEELDNGPAGRGLYRSLQAYLDEHGIAERDPMTLREAVRAIRAEKLPDPAVQASAGSFFKNVIVSRQEGEVAANDGVPVHEMDGDRVKINSGWLIEQAGLKGQLLHGIRVSDKAALVLINESAESFKDLAMARTEIRQKVLEKFGFDLEQEPEEIV